MAIAVFVSSPAEVDKFTAIGLDLGSRLESAVAFICVEPKPVEKKPDKEKAKDKPKEKAKEKAKPAANETEPAAAENKELCFGLSPDYSDAMRTAVEKHMATMKYGFVQFDVMKAPAGIDALRAWLSSETQSPSLGHFEIETLFVPMLRGSGVEHERECKYRLFGVAQCETVYLVVDPENVGRMPLNDIGIAGASQDDALSASRFARRLANVKVTRYDKDDEQRDQSCVILGIPGRANQTKIEGNNTWSSISKNREIHVAMILNPADTLHERVYSAIDDKMRTWFAAYQMDRVKRKFLAGKLESGAESSPEFILFMGVATFLACIGLIQDSAAVIIGAMLVAPLMTPLLGAGMAMITGNLPLFYKALRSISLGVGLSFFIGTLVGLVSLCLPDFVFSGSGLVLTNEMIARSQPNILDPFIGLAAGLAGGFAIGRDGQIGTVAGVAIAAALVPPIATAGLEAAIAIACATQMGDPFVFFQLLQRDPGELLEGVGLIASDFRPTKNVHLVTAPLLLFVLNACATIIGAWCGLRMVGMHRTRQIKQSRAWVPVVFVLLLLAVIVFLVLLPFFTLTD